MFQVSVTALLNTISAYWHMAGVALHRARADHRPGQPPVASATSSARRSTSRASDAGTTSSSPMFWYVFGTRPADVAVHDHRLRRLGAHGRGDASGITRRPIGMYMSVVVSVIFGFILLLAVTFAIPSTEGALENIGYRRPVDLGRVDEPELGGGTALHLRRRAVLLRHGVGHVGVADDVRVLARPRRARPSALAAGRGEPRPALRRGGDRRLWRAS